MDICRLLLSAGASDTNPFLAAFQADHLMYVIRWLYGSTALIRFIQQHVYYSYSSLPLQDRVGFLSAIRPFRPLQLNYSGPEICLLIMGVTSLTNEILTTQDSMGNTMLHWIANILAAAGYNEFKQCHDLLAPSHTCLSHDAGIGGSHYSRCRSLAREVIGNGSPLHFLDIGARTPLFLLLLCEEMYYDKKRLTEEQRLRIRRLLLYTWLSDLQVSGVDLQQYGEEEQRYGLVPNMNIFFCVWKSRPHLISFSYGPRVEDWKLWFSEPTDRYAGQFWRMIETLQEEDDQFAMPGAWMEYSELSDSDDEPFESDEERSDSE